MSSLWTPDGERPIRRDPQAAPGQAAPSSAYTPGGPAADSSSGVDMAAGGEREPSPEEQEAMMAQLDELRQQLATAPVEAVVANHAYGLFELAAVHLSTAPPQLPQARLAIDALAAVVEGLEGRLGDAEASLRDGLSQLRLAYVEVGRLGGTA